jgi:hypothetical protein
MYLSVYIHIYDLFSGNILMSDENTYINTCMYVGSIIQVPPNLYYIYIYIYVYIYTYIYMCVYIHIYI